MERKLLLEDPKPTYKLPKKKPPPLSPEDKTRTSTKLPLAPPLCISEKELYEDPISRHFIRSI